MLYSQTSEDRQINFFRSMLVHLMEGDEAYKNLIDPIIIDARDLALGYKNYFNIDRNNYHVIVRLARLDTAFLESLNIHNVSIGDYSHIDSTLAKQRQLTFA